MRPLQVLSRFNELLRIFCEYPSRLLERRNFLKPALFLVHLCFSSDRGNTSCVTVSQRKLNVTSIDQDIAGDKTGRATHGILHSVEPSWEGIRRRIQQRFIAEKSALHPLGQGTRKRIADLADKVSLHYPLRFSASRLHR